MDKLTKAYIAKMFPCEKPCDYFGLCENCSNANIFKAGYNFGVNHNKNTKVNKVKLAEVCCVPMEFNIQYSTRSNFFGWLLKRKRCPWCDTELNWSKK
jgi:hypothetical protein